ncbi:MAG: hypothetical protein FJ128_10440 [Deltaproteobacteria bacterium]|nr:hypothetical protein [Deltaproteobacteria bacterium]
MKKKAAILVMALWLAASGWPGNAGAQSLVGIWRSYLNTAWGLAYQEVIFMANGTFTKSARVGTWMARDVGTYTVGENYVHFNITDHEPKYYLGKPLQWVKSETWFFQFEGADRVVFFDRITNQRWVAHRSAY